MSSNSGFTIKPQLLIIITVIVVLIGLSFSLRNVADNKSADPNLESGEIAQVDTGDTRITGISSPSGRISGQGQATAARAPQKKSEPRKQIVEDFEMAQRRAEGDSVITGRIFGNMTEPGQENQENDWRERMRERFRGGDDNNSSRTRDRADNNNSDGNTGFGWLGAGTGDQETSDRQAMRDRFQAALTSASASGDPRMAFMMSFGNNKPLENAEVFLYEDDPNTTHPPLRTVVTDKEGSFTITGVNGADQRYLIVAKADKFAPEATFVSVNEPKREVMMRLDKGVPLRGKVVDAETSQPIAGATVYQPNSRWESSSALGVTTTSLNGEFYFPNTQEGRNSTTARAPGYATSRARVRAPDEKSIIELQPGGATITGTTVDRLTGKPQGGAKVVARSGYETNESVISSEDGTFKIENLPAGDYEVYALRGMKSESQKFELDRGGKKENVELILPAELLVSGQVINTKDRSPMQGIKVWFESTKGAQFRKTNSDGRFSFETMAIDEYSILIHEQGFLPVQESRTTDVKETITRKVAKNQSSDELTIRLKPVPTVAGTVTGQAFGRGGRGGTQGGDQQGGNRQGGQPVNEADITLGFQDGRDFYQLKTKSDPAGNFFINLPNGERGEGVLVASKDFALDTKDVRVPRKQPVNLHLQREIMSAEVMLSDQSPLDGIRVEVTKALSENREDSNLAHRVKVIDLNTMRGGRLFGPLPNNTNVQLTFHLPDGQAVSKDFKTNQLLNNRNTFIYDPVSQDVVVDSSPRDRNRDWSRWGDRGRGFPDGNPIENRNRQNSNNNGSSNGGNGGNGSNSGNGGNSGNGNNSDNGGNSGNNTPPPAAPPATQ